METIDGFRKAESKHGVRYMRFVGDVDSSVHPALLENVPVWGLHIKKLELTTPVNVTEVVCMVSNNPGYKD